MPQSSSTLPALIARLRVALAADARVAHARPQCGLEAMVLALVLRLLAQFESLAHAWQHGPQPEAHAYADTNRLPFHLRLRDARRAVIHARGSRGRCRIPTWRARNRGARAIPRTCALLPRLLARAPPSPGRA